MKIARMVVIAVLALAAMPAAIAFAQYPEPLGVCEVTPNQSSFPPNSVATFTVTTRTASGAPFAGQSGTVAIASGQGQVLTPTFTTGAGGTATIQVQTGATPGNLSLAVTCGALQATGVVSVSAPTGTAQPKPPDTGLGTTESATFPLAFVLAGIALLGVAGTTGATVYIRRK